MVSGNAHTNLTIYVASLILSIYGYLEDSIEWRKCTDVSLC